MQVIDHQCLLLLALSQLDWHRPLEVSAAGQVLEATAAKIETCKLSLRHECCLPGTFIVPCLTSQPVSAPWLSMQGAPRSACYRPNLMADQHAKRAPRCMLQQGGLMGCKASLSIGQVPDMQSGTDSCSRMWRLWRQFVAQSTVALWGGHISASMAVASQAWPAANIESGWLPSRTL